MTATQADILLMTTAPLESAAVLKAAEEATGHAPTVTTVESRTYHDLGEINGSRVFLARCQQGTGGTGGSQEAARIAIQALRPGAVIMVGFAFGINEKKQSIGDVLVSRQLCLYDMQRVGTDAQGNAQIRVRGDRPAASPRLIDWLDAAQLDLMGGGNFKIRFGLVFTGDKLVDNLAFRQQLLSQEPEAIGGEMEGAGLYVACQNEHVDWVVVKAICDWGNEKGTNKNQRQKKAAKNAADFVMYALMLAPLTPPERSPSSPPEDTGKPQASLSAKGPVQPQFSIHQFHFYAEDRHGAPKNGPAYPPHVKEDLAVTLAFTIGSSSPKPIRIQNVYIRVISSEPLVQSTFPAYELGGNGIEPVIGWTEVEPKTDSYLVQVNKKWNVGKGLNPADFYIRTFSQSGQKLEIAIEIDWMDLDEQGSVQRHHFPETLTVTIPEMVEWEDIVQPAKELRLLVDADTAYPLIQTLRDMNLSCVPTFIVPLPRKSFTVELMTKDYCPDFHRVITIVPPAELSRIKTKEGTLLFGGEYERNLIITEKALLVERSVLLADLITDRKKVEEWTQLFDDVVRRYS